MTAPAADWLAAKYLFVLGAVYALPLVVHSLWDLRPERDFHGAVLWKRWMPVGSAVLATILFCGILVLRSDVARDFIYFQF